MTQAQRRALLREAPGNTLLSKLRALGGVSWPFAHAMCRRCGLLPSTPWGRRTSAQVEFLASYLVQVPNTGPQRAQGQREILRKIRASGERRGKRRRKGRPVRGQRTSTNAATARRLNRGRVRGL